MSSPPVRVVVSGDVIRDRHIYAGEGSALAASSARDTVQHDEDGGAVLIQRLLEATRDLRCEAALEAGKTAKKKALEGDAVSPQEADFKAEAAVLEAWRSQTAPGSTAGTPGRSPGFDVALGLRVPEPASLPEAHAVWAPFPSVDGGRDEAAKTRFWRVLHKLGYGGDGPKTPSVPPGVPRPDVLVLDDGGYRFREASYQPAWHLPTDGSAPTGWIILKHAAPLAQGELWHALASLPQRERLVCLVAADDLRKAGVGLSRGLSWDATVQQLAQTLQRHHVASRLCAFGHLVVTFMSDGALWLDSTEPGRPRATLVFDAEGAEGEWASRYKGEAFGYHAAFAAALAQHLARLPAGGVPDLVPAIGLGLAAMRDLRRGGHGEVEAGKAAPEHQPRGYPVKRLATVLASDKAGFARALIPWPPDAGGGWSILEMAHRLPGIPGRTPDEHPQPLLGLAMEVARRGTAALAALPSARFGKLTTADRGEIEALRHLRSLMRGYEAQAKPDRPLSIGVFGPPGAGKSFGVRELANSIFGRDAWLEFNLSQFAGPEELYGAFHRIRDGVLAGRTPVAFWDEFDSQDLRWLQYMLAPMQDGTFAAGQLIHAIGKCVFVFAGGTAARFGDFAEGLSSTNFAARKGPDFTSRLDAHLDVLGPNPRRRKTPAGGEEDVPDPGMPLRRALMLRGQLRLDDRRLIADDGLLRALLTTRSYRHGNRSYQKLIAALHRDGALTRSALPLHSQLAMLVDTEDFVKRLAPGVQHLDDLAFAGQVETLAASIHATWKGWMDHADEQQAERFAAEYAGLEEDAKEVNRAAARRMPGVLALAGLALCHVGDAPPEDVVVAHLEAQLDRLARAEHDGWMDHLELHGWKLGPRDDKARRHPSMLRFEELGESEKDKDRNSVRNYPRFARAAGLGISLLC